MPYFRKSIVNPIAGPNGGVTIDGAVLLVHIPKTGGTSVEHYFYNKYGIKHDITNFYGFVPHVSHSLQHCTYLELKQFHEQIDFNDPILRIISIVRNPYERVVSDLFFYKLISDKSTNDEVEVALRKYFNDVYDYDNHRICQYLYLLDENRVMSDKILVLRTENLTDGMINLGYTDFQNNDNVTYRNRLEYMELLNGVSVEMINSYYREDFEYFGYCMKSHIK